MPLANLYNVPSLTNEHDFSMFSFNNQDQHRQIAQELYAQKGLSIPLYPLDPITFNDIATWAMMHQDAHNNQNAALDIAGVDLTDVNFQDPGELASWIYLHASEHMQAAAILGLS